MAVRNQAQKTLSGGRGKKVNLTDAHLEEVARLFGMLAESSRLKLLRALLDRPMTVSELIEATGMRQGNVSKHLGTLLLGGFVGREREGNFARYTIADPTVASLCMLMCSRIESQARKRVKQLA
jgi:DNA-binding transcriptional ArsR family regulator